MDVEKRIEQLKKEKIELVGPDGQPLKISPDGSVGIMALGYKGILKWKQVRNQVKKTHE